MKLWMTLCLHTFLLVSTANTSMKPAAEEDDVIDTTANMPLSSFTDAVAVNFDDEWDENVDDLVSWTNTLNL